jgi:hypothetical protein
LFHTGRENPTDLAPTLDKTHEDSKNKSTTSWRDITLKHLDTVMAYIQHIAKENSKIRKQLVQIHSNSSSKILKMYPKKPEFLHKAAYKVYLYKEESA